MTLSNDLSQTSFISAPAPPEDTFKILVATDIHLGYGEKEANIADDSFTTFEEILQIANSRCVDFILFAGDLFHAAEPSIKTMNECIRLLRLYVLGDKDIGFDFLSNQEDNFPTSLTQGVNYEDSNLNISYPIFTIHGNHDDVINNTSALDVLSSTGLINYFGQWKDLTNIKVSPILLKKGDTKLALYGLNHIPDRRLHHLMSQNKFNISMPDNAGDMFSMFVLHQNRADRGAKNFVIESSLPSFINLVIWGHEHDCRIEPEPSNDTFIIQPGSSVATSLCEGESTEKKVGILEICKNKFKMTPISLRTVRPFIFRSIDIKDHIEDIKHKKGDTREQVEKILEDLMTEMLSEVKFSGHTKQPTLPLIRLRVIYDESQHLINTKRFGQKYANIVANPDDVLLYKKNIVKRLTAVKNEPNKDVLDAALQQRDTQDRVEDVVASYFKQTTDEKDQLQLFNLESLSEVCQMIVDRDDEWGASKILDLQYDAAKNFLKANEVSEDRLKDALKHFVERESKDVFEEGLRVVKENREQAITKPNEENNDDDDGDDDSFNGPPAKKPATRGRGRGRGAAKTSAQVDSPNTSTRGARGGRGRKVAVPQQPSIAQRLAHRSTQNKSVLRDFLTDSE